jgi:hypothetical protein
MASFLFHTIPTRIPSGVFTQNNLTNYTDFGAVDDLPQDRGTQVNPQQD